MIPDPGQISRERVVELAKGVCTASSRNGEEEALARYVASTLKSAGVEAELDYVLPRRPNVVARVKGTGQGPGLLLNAHTDASYFPAEGWSRDPHDPWVAGNRVYGAAITDMLGALASMMATMEAAAAAPPPGDLVLLASMHHDTIGLGVKYALSSGSWPAYGICGEPSSLAIQTSNGGAAKFEVTFSGRLAHVSRLEAGVDALAAAVDFAKAVRTYSFKHETEPRLPNLPLLLIGQMEGGTAPGAVAASAVVRGDVRYVPSMTREGMRQELQSILDATVDPRVGTRLEFTAVQRPFMGPTSGVLIETLRAAHRLVLGRDPEVGSKMPGQAFITDAADMQAAGVESVVYGPADWHVVPDESADIDELTDAARVYLAAAHMIGGTDPPARL